MWVKVSDDFPEQADVLEAASRLGPTGLGRLLAVWLRGTCHCNQRLTDGFVSEVIVAGWVNIDRRPHEVMEAMIPAGITASVPGGWRFVHHLRDQPSKEKIEKRAGWQKTRQQVYATPGLIAAIRERDQDICRYCGVHVRWNDRRSEKAGTYDHVIPVSRGGTNDIDNVVVCCSKCNYRKCDRTLEQAGLTLQLVPIQLVTSSELANFKSPGTRYPVQEPQEPSPTPNVALLTRLAHDVLDLIGTAEGESDEDGAVVEMVKTSAAKAHVAYDSTSVGKAVESALWQRRNRTDPSAPGTFGNNPADAAEWLLRAILTREGPMDIQPLSSAVLAAAAQQWPLDEDAGFRADVVRLAWQQVGDGLPLWPDKFAVIGGKAKLR